MSVAFEIPYDLEEEVDDIDHLLACEISDETWEHIQSASRALASIVAVDRRRSNRNREQ